MSTLESNMSTGGLYRYVCIEMHLEDLPIIMIMPACWAYCCSKKNLPALDLNCEKSFMALEGKDALDDSRTWVNQMAVNLSFSCHINGNHEDGPDLTAYK